MTTRRRFSGEFKVKVALEALRGAKTIQEIAARHKVPSEPSQHLEAAGSGGDEGGLHEGAERRRGEHEAEIGELTVERDFLAKGLKW